MMQTEVELKHGILALFLLLGVVSCIYIGRTGEQPEIALGGLVEKMISAGSLWPETSDVGFGQIICASNTILEFSQEMPFPIINDRTGLEIYYLVLERGQGEVYDYCEADATVYKVTIDLECGNVLEFNLAVDHKKQAVVLPAVRDKWRELAIEGNLAEIKRIANLLQSYKEDMPRLIESLGDASLCDKIQAVKSFVAENEDAKISGGSAIILINVIRGDYDKERLEEFIVRWSEY